MAIVDLHLKVRRFLPIVALIGLLPTSAVEAQTKLSAGLVPIADKELNSPIDENSPNALMRPVPLVIQQAKDPLVKLVYETREAQRRRLLSTSENTPWQIMHGMLALREEFLIRHNGEPVNCLEWIKTGPTFENENWFEKTQVRVLTQRGGKNSWEMMTVGRGHPYNGKWYAFEGHINQFVAILSMSGVPLETQFNTPQGPVSMRDMLTYAKMTVNEKDEVTWTLWALSRYLPPDAEWTNAKGEKWSIERLVKIETAKSLQGAPCGGTHGLFALAHARNVYLRSGKPLVGVWQEAEFKIRRYIQTARMQQNSNGTLSSNYFRGREYKQNFDKRMASSGHLLEFLMMALPSQELNAPWVRRAIEATANDLMANRNTEVFCSPLYHATSALSVYLDRITTAAPNIAQGAPKTRTISNSKELKTEDAAPTRPVVDEPEAVTAEDVHSEAVKTPVMESSRVDSNGAPKALTEPVTTVPDVPVQAETGSRLAPGEATPDPQPAREPVSGESIPLKVESGGVDKIRVFGPRSAPATHITPKSNPAADKIRVDVSQLMPNDSLASKLQITVSSQAALGIPVAAPQGPATPVPPVPAPCELLFTLPDDQLVPTPVADPSSEQPDDKELPPAELPTNKKSERWRATPPERRKVIVVEEKNRGV